MAQTVPQTMCLKSLPGLAPFGHSFIQYCVICISLNVFVHKLAVASSHSFIGKYVCTGCMCVRAKLISGPSAITLCLLRKGLFFEFRSHLSACLASQPSQGICCLPTKNWDYRWLPSWPAFMSSGDPDSLLAPTFTPQVLYLLNPLPSSIPPSSPPSSFKEKEKKKKPFVKSQVSVPSS